MSEGVPSRRASTASRASTSSNQGHPSAAAAQNATLGLSRLPLGPRQSSVSMFTGRSDGPASPSPSNQGDAQQSALSPGSIDRVFPVRSAVSIDPLATPMSRGEGSDGFPGMKLGLDGGLAARRESRRNNPGQESTSPPGKETPPRETGSPAPRRMSIRGQIPKNEEVDQTHNDDKRRISESTITTASNKVDSHTLNTIMGDAASTRSDNASSLSGGMSLGGSRPPSVRDPTEPGLYTARFKHVVTDGGHAVITGRDGDTLQRCEDEPIHIPGAIQSFGLLLAFREEGGKLVVRVASENSAKIIGYSPSQLFKLDNLLDIFTEEQADNLLDHLDFIRDDEAADVVANGPEVFMLSIRPPQSRTKKLWCAMHLAEADRDLVVCEFEVEDDPINPLVPADESTPELPEDTLGSNPTEEEYHESTINISKPLRVLRSARKKRGEAAAMEVFNIMSQVQEQLANAPTLQVFLKVLIGVVKELSGFHRVMIYQFDQTWNGRVVAELVDPRATKDLYKGLNFPASDIPRQARELYKLNKVRLLYDRDQETSRLVCRTVDDLEHPVDMTHAYLRAMSPIHLKYLGNMAVRSSMSISINAFNELWGLIACHSYGVKGMRVSFPIRKMCRLVGDTASRNIERLSYASRLQARKLINTTSSSANPSGYIVASSDDLLKLFDADLGALSIRDETKVMGNPQSHLQEILAVVEYLRLRRLNTTTTSQDINIDFPDLRFAPGLKFLAGFLFVPLSSGGNDFIIFFRRGVLQEVKWAGNPYEKFVKEGTEGYLEPRKSFKTWSETIVGRCRDWTEEQIETASVLCLVYGKFIDVWRQKEAALQNSQLTRLLLANSAHEVRTPLNAIINYLEIALEGSLDQETRDNLAKSHSASKSLVYVINDLLDLTKTEEGKELVKEEPFDLSATLKEAFDPFVGDAKRKAIEYSINNTSMLPKQVIGDPRRVRQVVSNLIANAIQHTFSGYVKVEASTLAELTNLEKYAIEIIVEDTGAGMSQSKVDALFQELEEVSYEGNLSDSKLVKSDPFTNRTEGDKTTLGLGLAVVARTVRNMNGQLRLKTEEGKGSRFVIQLSFDLDRSGSTKKSLEHEAKQALPTPSPSKALTMGSTEGEVLIVDGNSQKRPESSMKRKESADSVHSLASLKSGRSVNSISSQRSDADRLIDAIQEPLFSETRISRNSSTDKPAARPRSAGAVESPTRQSKSRSIGSTRDLRSSFQKVPGQEKVMDSGTPVKPVKVPDESIEQSSSTQRRGPSIVFDEPDRVTSTPLEKPEENMSPSHYSVLVAEDDPINSKIMKKRLERLGHQAYMTVNGEECSSAHGEQASSFDAVLMDLQMPIVDGFSSTKMIRSFEKTQPGTCLSPRAACNGRIPIFAVSASLVESEKDKYVQTGFDGWILKPVDFKRVDQILKGIVDDDVRNDCLYQHGKWEQGGWFEARQTQKDMFDVETRPSGLKPTAEAQHLEDEGRSSDPNTEGSLTPRQFPTVPKADTL